METFKYLERATWIDSLHSWVSQKEAATGDSHLQPPKLFV